MSFQRGRSAATSTITVVLALILSMAANVATQSRASQAPRPATPSAVSTTRITPVEGPSTLHHLGLTIEKTSMGWAGQWSGPPPTVPASTDAASKLEPAGGPFVLSGADLYRVSCRSCHKPDGTGTENEIHSLIGPVQAASFQWMTESMRARGRPVDAAFIRQLTTANEADLRARLRQGGHDMPAFGQISDQEYKVLRPYLDQMAGLRPSTAGPRTIAEPVDRVGELIVKGTCHVCHDAVQPNQGPTTVLSGVIPSLASMTQMKAFTGFVHKVEEGAPVPLNASGVMSRGRMPVFNYLTDAEVAAAYSYLSTYPPR
jgi:mono/diheme cytochrome c family protein